MSTEDLIQKQLKARLAYHLSQCSKANPPVMLDVANKLACENAALRRLCDQAADFIVHVDLGDKVSCCLFDKLISASRGEPVEVNS